MVAQGALISPLSASAHLYCWVWCLIFLLTGLGKASRLANQLLELISSRTGNWFADHCINVDELKATHTL